MGKLMDKKFHKSSPSSKYKYSDLFPTNVVVDSSQRNLTVKNLWRHSSPDSRKRTVIVTELPPISPGGTVQRCNRRKYGGLVNTLCRLFLVSCLCLVTFLNTAYDPVNENPIELFEDPDNAPLNAGILLSRPLKVITETTRLLGNDSQSSGIGVNGETPGGNGEVDPSSSDSSVSPQRIETQRIATASEESRISVVPTRHVWLGDPPPTPSHPVSSGTMPPNSLRGSPLFRKDGRPTIRGQATAIVLPFHLDHVDAVLAQLADWPRPSPLSTQLRPQRQEREKLPCTTPLVVAVAAGKSRAEDPAAEKLLSALASEFEQGCLQNVDGLPEAKVSQPSRAQESTGNTTAVADKAHGGVYVLWFREQATTVTSRVVAKNTEGRGNRGVDDDGRAEAAAGLFYGLFPALAPFFSCFFLLPPLLMTPLTHDWGSRVQQLSTLSLPEENLASVSPITLLDKALNRVREEWWQLGAPLDLETQDLETLDRGDTSSAGRDPHGFAHGVASGAGTLDVDKLARRREALLPSAGSMFVLGCEGMDDYLSSVRSFYPPRGEDGGSCVQQGGCEIPSVSTSASQHPPESAPAGLVLSPRRREKDDCGDESATLGVGTDAALHEYRHNPLNPGFADSINRKFVDYRGLHSDRLADLTDRQRGIDLAKSGTKVGAFENFVVDVCGSDEPLSIEAARRVHRDSAFVRVW